MTSSAPAPAAAERAAARIDSLDGLRGLAAVTVVVSHFSNKTHVLDRMFGEGAGQVGVMLFFALSGFLMGKLYLDTRLTLAHLALFARRRVARVFPLYYAWVLASFVAGLLGMNGLYPITSSNLLQHLLFIKGKSVLWTIPVEVQFYALFPLLWLAFRGSQTAAITAMAAAVVALLSGLFFVPVLSLVLTLFLSGLLVSRVRLPPSSSLAFAVLLIAYVVMLPGVLAKLGLATVKVWFSPPHVLLIAALLLLSLRSPLAIAVLGNAWARYMGRISYSIYLVHIFALQLSGQLFDRRKQIFLYGVAFVASTLAAASATYFLIERPARNLLRGRDDVAKAPLPQTA